MFYIWRISTTGTRWAVTDRVHKIIVKDRAYNSNLLVIKYRSCSCCNV